VFRDALFQQPRPVWAPADLDKTLVRIEVFAPDNAAPIFDSNADGATLPFSLNDLRALLLPGESLRVKKVGATDYVAKLSALTDDAMPPAPWIDTLIRRLPVEDFDTVFESRGIISTALGSFDVTLTGDVRSVNRALATVATRCRGLSVRCCWQLTPRGWWSRQALFAALPS